MFYRYIGKAEKTDPEMDRRKGGCIARDKAQISIFLLLMFTYALFLTQTKSTHPLLSRKQFHLQTNCIVIHD